MNEWWMNEPTEQMNDKNKKEESNRMMDEWWIFEWYIGGVADEQ